MSPQSEPIELSFEFTEDFLVEAMAGLVKEQLGSKVSQR
jgi:hypothetical protein